MRLVRFDPWSAPWSQSINQAFRANMATEPRSAKRSLALFASKPMVFLNAAKIRLTTITLDRCYSGFGGSSPIALLLETLETWIDVQFAHLFAV